MFKLSAALVIFFIYLQLAGSARSDSAIGQAFNFTDWLHDHADFEQFNGKFEMAKREGAEELQEFADEVKKRRHFVQRKYADSKWRLLERGQQWSNEFESQFRDVLERMRQLELTAEAKVNQLLSDEHRDTPALLSRMSKPGVEKNSFAKIYQLENIRLKMFRQEPEDREVDKQIRDNLNICAQDAFLATLRLEKFMDVIEEVEELMGQKRRVREDVKDLVRKVQI
ncbi:hypothetical protein HDE_04470 [Halotydeus destructor]|nr:hypothetical protein HDE_04470 [Halotydeus destructor]